MVSRPWRAPDRHWPERPDVVGGLDVLAGGSWFGLNDRGVMATILNRVGTLGPAAGKRSRGTLVLEALEHASAQAAADLFRFREGAEYRAFNMLIADGVAAYWVCHREDGGPVQVQILSPGVSMLAGFDLNDDHDPRIRAYGPTFRLAPPPVPESGDWSAWQALLASRTFAPEAGPKGAMCFMTGTGFGTGSSSLMALPAPRLGRAPLWLFAAGPPDRTAHERITALESGKQREGIVRTVESGQLPPHTRSAASFKGMDHASADQW
ncbi:MAG: hypothetical protein FD149_2735 [Rhodospirillaceae bacterium]|nr:MAG: hypothetical protein FD149_2735 [Rhodospirillaceae bacterium]